MKRLKLDYLRCIAYIADVGHPPPSEAVAMKELRSMCRTGRGPSRRMFGVLGLNIDDPESCRAFLNKTLNPEHVYYRDLETPG